MQTIRLTMAQAAGEAISVNAADPMIDGQRAAALPGRLRHFRPRQRHLPGSEALEAVQDRAADLARPERAVDGPGGDRLRQGHEAPPDHDRHLIDRPGRHQHGHGRRRCHTNRLPLLILSGDIYRQPSARSRAPAGRAIRRPDDLGQRRLQAGHPLLGPHHPSRADHPVAAPGHSRQCWTRPTAARPSSGLCAGHPGDGLRLSRWPFFETRRPAQGSRGRGRTREQVAAAAELLLKSAKKPF